MPRGRTILTFGGLRRNLGGLRRNLGALCAKTGVLAAAQKVGCNRNSSALPKYCLR
jgi:hypothetical protein